MIPGASKQEYIVVDHNDLDRFIQEKLGYEDYECVAMQEWSNDSSYQMWVDGELSEYDKEDLENRKLPYRLRAIMNKLCKDGHIERGQYLIEVSW